MPKTVSKKILKYSVFNLVLLCCDFPRSAADIATQNQRIVQVGKIFKFLKSNHCPRPPPNCVPKCHIYKSSNTPRDGDSATSSHTFLGPQHWVVCTQCSILCFVTFSLTPLPQPIDPTFPVSPAEPSYPPDEHSHPNLCWKLHSTSCPCPLAQMSGCPNNN